MLEQKVLSNQMPIAIKDSKIDITSEKLTKELAKKFTKYLKGGEFVFLYGEMGVGKTTFVKYFINEYQKINNLTQIELWNNHKNYENKVYVLPKHLDEKVATLHLKKVGAKLTKLSKEQAYYISVGTEGPFKPDAYRY